MIESLIMALLHRIKQKLPHSWKKKLNHVRYTTVPTLKKHVIRMAAKSSLPHNADGKVLIHLGCGDQNDSRYINVDSIPFRHVHFLHDVTKLPMFGDDTADLVYGSHILEHTSYKLLLDTLHEWKRVLKPGGVLRIAVPDFDKILAIYEAEKHNIAKIEGPLMGGQNYKYNFHYAVFNRDYLAGKLKEAGFALVREWNPATAEYYTFTDWASKLLYGTYPISLNLEAVK